MEESLLDEFEFLQNNPLTWQRTEEQVIHIKNEISILESLKRIGRLELRDGLSVQDQIESRYEVLRDISQNSP